MLRPRFWCLPKLRGCGRSGHLFRLYLPQPLRLAHIETLRTQQFQTWARIRRQAEEMDQVISEAVQLQPEGVG